MTNLVSIQTTVMGPNSVTTIEVKPLGALVMAVVALVIGLIVFAWIKRREVSKHPAA